jgi:transcriptional regulator with GAF, ATPase, and Fis domain
MSQQLTKLSEEQWEFLAVLDAFGCPVPIDVAGHLAPLLPGPLFDLIEKCEERGWIKKIGNNRFSMAGDLPPDVLARINAINSPAHLGAIAGKIYAENLIPSLDHGDILPLLDKAGRVKEASECEIALARRAFGEKRPAEGREYIEQAVRRLSRTRESKDIAVLFIPATLELSDLCFSQGHGFAEIEGFLMEALEAAGRVGDRRSEALIHLHFGRLYYFSDRRLEALTELSTGLEGIKELGDEDILARAATFLGLFYFLKGRFKEALDHLERAEQGSESGTGIPGIDPLTPILLGYAATYLGQFHRAIGSMDFHWRLAMERSDQTLACTTRAVLGTILVLVRKDREAAIHLQQAYEDAEQSKNALAMYFAGGGIALQHFLQGRMEDAYASLKKTILMGRDAGLIRQYASPWYLEAVYEFHRLGFEPIPEFEFAKMLERIWKGVNIHLKGVALRISAREKMLQRVDRASIEKDLDESETCLRESGDPVQLSKTFQERARLELRFGNREEARGLVLAARKMLGGYVDEFFPDEFQHLLGNQETLTSSAGDKEEFLGRLLEMIESLYPSQSQNEILARVLTATSRMFGAERSGLFWFPSGKFSSHPELRATCNLTRNEVGLESFRVSMAMILKTFRTNQPQTRKTQDPAAGPAAQAVRSVLCIPIEMQGSVHGVLYYDNSYLDGAFEFLDPVTIKKMVGHTNLVVERRLNHLRLQEQKNLLASEKALYVNLDKKEMIAQSKTMTELLDQADQIARTESTVLILGETGTGKELLAKRIHAKSARSEAPFVVVDSTTIPENLLESELFGHERGAFTGADRQKIGRIELAHQGTLFLDEVGELPLSAQVKLLRVLQEKTFNRVGGNRTINSDFRLIAATSRDLAAEVAAGRFREDLYYRLNVIPIHLPPLRERPEDIPLLADHYLKHYAAKYTRAFIGLTADQNKALCHYRWPGNIRELKNILERAVLLSGDNQLELNLPAEVQGKADHPFADFPSLEEVQRRYIREVLRRTGGKIAGVGGAAEILGMKRTSLYTRMRILGISR